MKKNFPIIKKPMLMLFAVSAIILALEDLSFLSSPLGLLGWLISLCVFQLIAQILAYLTFLIIQNKGSRGAWGNYIIWAFLLNFGRLAELINL